MSEISPSDGQSHGASVGTIFGRLYSCSETEEQLKDIAGRSVLDMRGCRLKCKKNGEIGVLNSDVIYFAKVFEVPGSKGCSLVQRNRSHG